MGEELKFSIGGELTSGGLFICGDDGGNWMPHIVYERVVHGYWIFEEYPDGYYHWECSKCGSQFSDSIVNNADEEWKYCPNCGAKMDGERRGEHAAD